MESFYLFTYGTLKSSQAEHAIHCLPPQSIQPAKAKGALWRLREGYPILEVDPNSAVLDATSDAVADWRRALAATASALPPSPEGKWIEGELFEYPLENGALRKMDLWENFQPGIKSPYQRRVIWVQGRSGNDRLAWAYVCYSPPNWATLLNQTSWS